MIGAIKCRVGRHDWVAKAVSPTARLSKLKVICARCGERKRDKKGRVILFRPQGIEPRPARAQRRGDEARRRKDDAMIRKAEREFEQLQREVGM